MDHLSHLYRLMILLLILWHLWQGLFTILKVNGVLKAGEFTSSVLTLDEDDLRSNLQVQTRHSRRDNFNTVSGMFSGAGH